MSLNDFKLSLAIDHTDGSHTRWGPGEVGGENIPTDLEFTTSIPGGFSDLQTTLLRRIDRDYPDQGLLDTVRVLGPGNQVAWEGRMAQFPRQHGDQFTVNPGAEGWVAHLRDDETFSEIYADRDLAGWQQASRARQLNLLTGGTTQTSGPEVMADTNTGLPALGLKLTGAWSGTANAEAWYDAGPGNLIGVVYCDGAVQNAAFAASNFTEEFRSGLTDDDTSTTVITTFSAANAGYRTVTNTRRYVLFKFVNTAAGGTQGTDYLWMLRHLTVYGDHGLTRQGSDPGGFYGGDIINHALTNTCPLLTWSTGTGGSIETGTEVISHLVFRDPTTCEDVVRKVTDYEGKEWGVYENKEFFWRDPDPDRTCWQVRLSSGAKPSFDGPAGQTLLNGVLVTYKDEAGTTHTVGPPGSGAETTDSSLADSSTTNPANQLGINKWKTLALDTTTSGGAIAVGAAWLTDRLSPQRRGSITLTGYVKHPTQGDRPCWQVRAGDYLQITDSNSTEQRRIIETRYSHASRSIECTLDNANPALDVLIQRMAAVLPGVI